MKGKVSRFTVIGLSGLVLFGAVFAMRLPSAAQQPGGQPPGGQPPGGGRGRGGPGGFDFSQFIDRALERMQLSDAERAAAKETWMAKNTARTALMEKVGLLREVSDNPQSSDADVTKALNDFAAAYAAYAKTVAEADGKLVKKITLRTRARLTAAGILENGVGFGGFGGFFRGGDFRRRDGGDRGGNRPGGSGGGERSGGQ